MAGMRVPTLTTRTVQAEGLAAPMMQARVSPADGGGLAAQGMIAAGQQVQELGGMIRQHALKMAEDDAKTEAMAAYNDWQSQRVGLLMGNEDAYFRRTGEDAYKAAEGINTALKTAWETRAGGMSQQARKMVEQRVFQDLQGDAMSVARHAAAEREKWRDSTAQATVQTMANEASLFYADPARRETALNTAREVIFSRAMERGWAADDPRLKVEVANFDSAALSGVLRRQAETDPMGAKAYFSQIGGRLSAADYAAASALLDQKTKLYSVDAAVREIKGAVGSGDYASRLMQVEGDGQNPRSSAFGVGQFTEGTWLDTVRRHAPETFEGRTEQEVLALRKVPEFATKMLSGLRADNAKVLEKGGVQVNPQSEYLAHFLGAGDALRVLKASPDTPVEAVVQAESRTANPEVFATVRTAGDMQAWAAQKMAGIGGGPPSRVVVWEQQRAAAAKIADPDIRAGVEAQLEREYRLGEATDAARRKTGQEEVYAQVLKGLNPAALPPEVQQVIGPDFVRQMQSLYQANGQAPYSYEIEAMLHQASLDGKSFAAMDLTALLGKHEKSRMEYWMGQQRSHNSKREPTYSTALDIVKEQFPVSGQADKTGRERQAKAAEQTRLWVDSYIEEKGQAPQSADLYRFVRSLKVKDKGGWFGGGGAPRVDVLGTDREGTFALSLDGDSLPDVAAATGIPRDVLPIVVEKMKKRGMPTTYDNLFVALGIPEKRLPDVLEIVRNAGHPLTYENLTDAYAGGKR